MVVETVETAAGMVEMLGTVAYLESPRDNIASWRGSIAVDIVVGMVAGIVVVVDTSAEIVAFC